MNVKTIREKASKVAREIRQKAPEIILKGVVLTGSFFAGYGIAAFVDDASGNSNRRMQEATKNVGRRAYTKGYNDGLQTATDIATAINATSRMNAHGPKVID